MLTSLQNPRVLLAWKLHRKNFRDDERAFLVEGPKVIAAAAAAGANFIDLFALPGDEALDLPLPIEPTLVSEPVMKAIADTATPQGPVGIVGMTDVGLEEIKETDLVLVLASVRDPGNAGTLLRSAQAAGAGAVIFTKGSVDPFSPKTVRASAGAVFASSLVRDVEAAEIRKVLDGFRFLGTDASVGKDVYTVELTGPIALFLGNEAWGLTEDVRRLMDGVVAIPMPGPAESLNVGVAGSLLLFEAVRQRREPSS